MNPTIDTHLETDLQTGSATHGLCVLNRKEEMQMLREKLRSAG